MASLAEGSRAGSNALGEVGAAVDSGHAARPAALDGHQDALPACASAAGAPVADGVIAAPAGNASILVRSSRTQEVAARGVQHAWRDTLGY